MLKIFDLSFSSTLVKTVSTTAFLWIFHPVGKYAIFLELIKPNNRK
jgi:hypothetical protein